MNEFDRWQQRYSIDDYLFGTEPNYFLESCKDLLPATGRALMVADGEGRNGVWMAEQGLDVTSIEFSPAAIEKARTLASDRGVSIDMLEADVHRWDYPEAAFDVVAEIFTQFSTPEERADKWAGMKRSLKSGGLLVLQGYRPKQLDYGTGGPKKVEQLYTQEMLEAAFGDFSKLSFEEENREIYEGVAHGGMSAVINLVGTK